jgi:hypothetical protein
LRSVFFITIRTETALSTAAGDADRVSIANDPLGLLVFRLQFDSRGRCGRYFTSFFGYLNVMQAKKPVPSYFEMMK